MGDRSQRTKPQMQEERRAKSVSTHSSVKVPITKICQRVNAFCHYVMQEEKERRGQTRHQ